jgi:multicomponent Na+:H+ antiporter subunit D
VAQDDFRRLLSFHIVSQIGYMILGLGLFSVIGLAGSILHIVHNVLAKTNLFLVSGIVHHMRGTYDLHRLGGLYRSSPWVSVLFLISAFSLAGMPPLSGFWSKLLLIKAGLESDAAILVAVMLLVSLLTLFSMTKIWNQVFWKKAPEGLHIESIEGGASQDTVFWVIALFPIILQTGLILAIGLVAEPCLMVIMRAAHQLLNPAEYIHSVLGGTP